MDKRILWIVLVLLVTGLLLGASVVAGALHGEVIIVGGQATTTAPMTIVNETFIPVPLSGWYPLGL